MKKMAKAMVLLWVLIVCSPVGAQAAQLLIPVGQIIGLELRDETVTVAAFDEAYGADARAAGLCVGDQLVKMDDCIIREAEDVLQALEHSDGDLEVVVRRGGKEHTLTLRPKITSEGPRLGIFLRQGITGIGTVTWYDPQTGSFGALGHGVNNGKGDLMSMRTGKVYEASVISVRKGCAGQPGQLRGAVTGEGPIGSLRCNTAQGVFGSAQCEWKGEALPVASNHEIKTGPAVIRSTVAGNVVREYSVEILKIYPEDRANGRNLMLRVTDPQLLNQTGGIVQGMSGSPILQDGRIVGAVTHVLVNDPTMGYGIFIENMLEAAG